jgi:hypothetical protein
MKMNNYILLLDPSLMHNGNSLNLGDLIINESIMKILPELFPGIEIKRVTSHGWIDEKQVELINKSMCTFVGGTNILTSDIRNAGRLTPPKRRIRYLFPKFSNVVLLGVGWEKYEPSSFDIYTFTYYNRILRRSCYQSVRDSYSKNKLKKVYMGKVLNTSCPTVWNLNTAFVNKFESSYNKILFTLTDYAKNPEYDSKLIESILNAGQKEIFFFPQGSKDIEYLETLDIYIKNKSKIQLLPYSFEDYIKFVESNEFNYIGTRLHGGIRCLQKERPTLIIGLDNRSLEIQKDINLNVVKREDITTIRKWIEGKFIPPALKLPYADIKKWKAQFLK